ncbi:hypothetical protein ACFFV7_32785 [Nonomuraea spiralis]|uniref:Uncharacterized protein n=1 Tax=Nonomuraea spiralis TaxID=46182 RepID=A0ABV5IN91_9ACTN|nr:hypothetical protein [Nonomuraea spiralis]GGT28648.1 hypothetical protein GCM10010176_086640 [Nonomuraea spiralis]
MSRLGPFITLAAGAVLAAGLGVASVTATPAPKTAAGTTAAVPAPEEPSAAETTATASPTPDKTEATTIPKADYGGYVKGNGGLIAISVRDGKAVGYFCDGKTEAWFKGGEAGGKVVLKGLGTARATATLGDGRARGWLSVGGGKWRFTAPAVVRPSGLYRATALVRGAKLRAGWIRVPRPGGGYDQVGAAFVGQDQVPIPKLDDERPDTPVTVAGTAVSPKDVDAFIEEMR